MKRVVLLHSALGDSRLWRRQIPVLEERFEVVAPDLPGYGTEPMPREAFSFVDRVAELLPALLVGNSFGGAVALQTALAHQDRVEKLVLVGSGFPGWSFGEEMTANWQEEQAALEAGDHRPRDRRERRLLGRAGVPRRGAPAAAPRARAADGAPRARGAVAGAARRSRSCASRRSS